MLKVGITGGIGGGKSTVAGIFMRLGIPVFYADAEAAAITNTDPEVLTAYQQLFGKDIIGETGLPDRKKIRDIVFHDETKREQVNKLVHPRVKARFDQWCSRQQAPFILKEAAILFESGANAGLDKVIVVTAPGELRIKRVMERDHVDEEQVKAVMKKQMNPEDLLKKADFIIYNDEQQLLIPQVLNIYEQLKKTANGRLHVV